MRHRTTEDKTARFDAGDLIDTGSGIRMNQFVDSLAETARML
jgi:hypothetical protein